MFIIVENFYQDPDSMRQYALSQEFKVKGNYPGLRTDAIYDDWRNYIKTYLEEKILHRKITNFPAGYNTAFQFTTKYDYTWVHHDDTSWAGVLYLTPNAPIESGTGIYRHKETGIYAHQEGLPDYNEIKNTYEDWELVATAGNIYNRLVLYRGNYYHRSILPGFGDTPANARLFQTFFFDSEL